MSSIYSNYKDPKEFWNNKKVFLSHIDMELTERCNNACIHCYINQLEDNCEIKSREMSTFFIEEILKQAANLGCLSVRFSGGEPLLRDDFRKIYLYTRRLGMSVTLFTNATLFTEELCQLFSKVPPGKPVSTTVYGMHANSYDAVVARKGAFEDFWHGIQLLQAYNIPLLLNKAYYRKIDLRWLNLKLLLPHCLIWIIILATV